MDVNVARLQIPLYDRGVEPECQPSKPTCKAIRVEKDGGCRAGVDFARIVEASTSPKFKPGDQLGPERSIGSYS
jgi:hypothetical protein